MIAVRISRNHGGNWSRFSERMKSASPSGDDGLVFDPFRRSNSDGNSIITRRRRSCGRRIDEILNNLVDRKLMGK